MSRPLIDLRNRLFYALKPLIPRQLQILLRRQLAEYHRRKNGFVWPIDMRAAMPPKGWPGWPGGKRFGLVLSHDVDTPKGYLAVNRLSDIEEEMGFRSLFNFVPERYGTVDIRMLNDLKDRGFGIGVHGLKHDGKLFSSKKIFDESARRINVYLRKWGTRGFTAPSMLHNHNWMLALDIDYCVSTFDTDPFEPQPEAARTIFPFWVFGYSPTRGFLELPYTLPQDSTLFIILQEKSIAIWTQKLDWIAQKGGMALLNTHPDYMNFGGNSCGVEEYPINFYTDFLRYIKTKYEGHYWHVLPAEIYSFLSVHFPHHFRESHLSGDS